MGDMERDVAKMLGKIGTDLEQSSQNLDEHTRRALKVSRYAALAQLQKPRRIWLPVTGLAAAMSMVILIFGIVNFQSGDNDIVQHVDDISLLSSGDDLEFYENLEFYQWLELEGRTS